MISSACTPGSGSGWSRWDANRTSPYCARPAARSTAGIAGCCSGSPTAGLAALIADNYAVEERAAKPAPGYHGALLPLHEHCLFKLGIHLGELWHLTPLAEWLHARGRYRFLLTAPPLRLPGAVGSPATPVATV